MNKKQVRNKVYKIDDKLHGFFDTETTLQAIITASFILLIIFFTLETSEDSPIRSETVFIDNESKDLVCSFNYSNQVCEPAKTNGTDVGNETGNVCRPNQTVASNLSDGDGDTCAS